MSNYHIKHLEEYFQVYRKSLFEPENFWEEIAEEHFLWHKRWDTVLEWDFKKPDVKWFKGARLNVAENCIDRHLRTRGDKTAIIFEPNNPEELAHGLAQYIESARLRHDMAAAGKEHARNVFSLEHMLDCYENEYRRL